MRFCEIPGQHLIKQRLIQSVIDNRVSHAQLFLGPEGSGKLALAIAYAQYINCRNRTQDDSCGTCLSCNKYNKLIHPDLHFLYPINKTKGLDDKKVTHNDFIISWREFLIENKGIVALHDWYDKIEIEKKQGIINSEDADSVNHTLAYKAYEAEYKVMIIWMIEKMNTVAANKLLKNLEEPPDKTLFLLISENHDQVISTVLSRTQLVKVPRLEESDILEFISATRQLTPDSALNISRLSEGNYRIAMDLADQISHESGSSDLEKERFQLLRDWMRRIYVYGVNQIEYDSLQEVIIRLVGDGSREKQKETLGYTLRIIRLCLQYNVGNLHLIVYTGEELDFISKFSTFIHPRNISQIDEEINRAIFHIERNANANIVFTDLSHLLARLIKIPLPAHMKNA